MRDPSDWTSIIFGVPNIFSYNYMYLKYFFSRFQGRSKKLNRSGQFDFRFSSIELCSMLNSHELLYLNLIKIKFTKSSCKSKLIPILTIIHLFCSPEIGNFRKKLKFAYLLIERDRPFSLKTTSFLTPEFDFWVYFTYNSLKILFCIFLIIIFFKVNDFSV